MKSDINRKFFWSFFIFSLLASTSVIAAEIPSAIKDIRYSKWYQVTAHNSYENYGDMNYLLGKVNSIEYDVHPSSNWGVYHTDGNYSATKCNHSLNICLKDVRDYHDANKNHPPITIFIEIKNDDGFKVSDFNGIFCGKTRNTTDGGRSSDDAVFACNELYRPGDLLGKYKTLREAAFKGTWGTLENLKGKIIFVINGPSSSLKKYMNETTLTKGDNANRKEASAFVMVDDAEKPSAIDTLCNDRNFSFGNKKSKCKDKNKYFDDLSSQNKNGSRHINNIVFFNSTCNTWNNDYGLGRRIRLGNLVSRGYFCDYQDNPNEAVNILINKANLNFVAYDGIENAFPPGSF